MDHALVAENTEEPGDEGEDVDESEDGDPDQELLLLRLELERFEGEIWLEEGGLEGCWG